MNSTQSNTQALIESNQALIDGATKHLESQGKTINLSHWLTLRRYAQKYGLESTMVVSNWISRGVVPSEDVIQVEELNGMKLIKDKSYKH